jgi:hypothetical protein
MTVVFERKARLAQVLYDSREGGYTVQMGSRSEAFERRDRRERKRERC